MSEVDTGWAQMGERIAAYFGSRFTAWGIVFVMIVWPDTWPLAELELLRGYVAGSALMFSIMHRTALSQGGNGNG